MSIISRLSYFEYDNNSIILTLLRDTLCNITHLVIDKEQEEQERKEEKKKKQ